MMDKSKVECSNCKKMVSKGNLVKHQKTKKCKNHNDKTAGNLKANEITPRSSGTTPNVSLPAELSKSKILSEINLNGEFQTMTEKINSKSKDEDKKYEHSCGSKFNERLKYCPGCGDELEA